MTQLDDVRAALTAIGSGLDTVTTTVTGIKADGATLATEVSTLIALVTSSTTAIPQDIVDQITAIQTRVSGVNTDLAAVDAQLKAIPAVPASGAAG